MQGHRAGLGGRGLRDEAVWLQNPQTSPGFKKKHRLMESFFGLEVFNWSPLLTARANRSLEMLCQNQAQNFPFQKRPK